MQKYELSAQWNGGQGGTGEIGNAHFKLSLAFPAETGGAGSGTSPEELLLAAVASCYMMTLAAIVERQHIGRLSLTAELETSGQAAKRIERIVLRPVITAAPGIAAEQIVRLRQAAERAKRACTISKALSGQIAVSVELQILFASD